MSTCVYLTAAEPGVDLVPLATRVRDALAASGRSVGVFRPLVASAASDQPLGATIGCTYADIAADEAGVLTTMIGDLETLATRYDAVLVVGSEYSDVMTPYEAELNARIALNLDCPVIAVVPGTGRSTDQIARATASFVALLRTHRLTVAGVAVTGVDGAQVNAVQVGLPDLGDTSVALVPDASTWNASSLVASLSQPRRHLRTVQRFEYEVGARARADKRTIVLPESGDDRILKAAAIVLEKGIADLILLGEPDEVRAQAARLGVDLGAARIHSMTDAAALERYAAAYAELRAAKGVTLEQAREKMADASYWGTMMVKLGEADAMVSGATHTTANTIRPAFEVVKTKPGIEVVSGAFFMCLADQVWLFADCAVNPNPTPSQLASIAISSAESAAAFGIEPRVAMLSYSTGTSGAGPDVDAVTEATRLVRERRPDLAVEGPLQFDAAVDPTVAALKFPGSPVAGQATVFVFPDLDAGNIAYKAVQRTAGVTAAGPILQGLNKVVTDLSRGALVEDIVSTIALTAVQAQAA